MGPSPRAAAALRATEVGGRGPKNQARRPEKLTKAVPGGRERKATRTAGGRTKSLPAPQAAHAAVVKRTASLRRGQAPIADSSRP